MESGEGGFTLIEMSIVLVIIGLIVGGVPTGQELIKASQMRAEVAQFDRWALAINTYYGKYQALPGDDPNAASNGLGPSGNGNGIIEFHSIWVGYVDGINNEGQNVWVHLANAGLYGGPSSTTSCVPGQGGPTSMLLASAGFDIFTSDYFGLDTNNGSYPYLSDGHIWVRMSGGNGSGFCDMGMTSNGLTSAQLFTFDRKYDDGMPYTGKIRAMGQDGVSNDTSLQIMCPAGVSCVYVANNAAFCTAGASGDYSETDPYLQQNAPVCPYAFRLSSF